MPIYNTSVFKQVLAWTLLSQGLVLLLATVRIRNTHCRQLHVRLEKSYEQPLPELYNYRWWTFRSNLFQNFNHWKHKHIHNNYHLEEITFTENSSIYLQVFFRRLSINNDEKNARIIPVLFLNPFIEDYQLLNKSMKRSYLPT